MAQPIDLARMFLHLGDDGGAEPVKVTGAFWSGKTSQQYDRVVGAFDFRSPSDLHASIQEMHPEVDEVLLLISGAIDVVLEEAEAERTIALEAGQAAIVPRGVWHRLVMRSPGRLLFINNRRGIRSRPLGAKRGDRACNPT
jgi:mannose-6-phosphate isomerase-like protein (cupin superfamily)